MLVVAGIDSKAVSHEMLLNRRSWPGDRHGPIRSQAGKSDQEACMLTWDFYPEFVFEMASPVLLGTPF